MTKKRNPPACHVGEARILEQQSYLNAIPEIVLLFDEELQQFHDWLRAKSDEPHLALTLRWIGEFEAFAEDDEQAMIEIKAMLEARDDAEAAVALKVIAWVEETVEPDPILKRFHDWLKAKGNNSTALLARWWLAEFEEVQEEHCRQGPPMRTLH